MVMSDLNIALGEFATLIGSGDRSFGSKSSYPAGWVLFLDIKFSRDLHTSSVGVDPQHTSLIAVGRLEDLIWDLRMYIEAHPS